MGAVHHKITGPNMVPMLRSESGTRPIIEPQTTSIRLLLGNLQPLLMPEKKFNTLVIHLPAFSPQAPNLIPAAQL
jgi:hypothetical protein